MPWFSSVQVRAKNRRKSNAKPCFTAEDVGLSQLLPRHWDRGGNTGRYATRRIHFAGAESQVAISLAFLPVWWQVHRMNSLLQTGLNGRPVSLPGEQVPVTP